MADSAAPAPIEAIIKELKDMLRLLGKSKNGHLPVEIHQKEVAALLDHIDRLTETHQSRSREALVIAKMRIAELEAALQRVQNSGEQSYRMAKHNYSDVVIARPVYEGIRAVLSDKDAEHD